MFNDFLTTGNDKQAVTDVIQAADKGFAIRDLGSLHYFLGRSASQLRGCFAFSTKILDG